MSGKQPITVWEFCDAPLEIQFKENGGDEDWVAVVHDYDGYGWIPWLDPGSGFGRCSVNEYSVADDGNVTYLTEDDRRCDEWVSIGVILPSQYHGCRIFIGCHA